MRFFRSIRHVAVKTSVRPARQQRTAWQNLILCVLGLVLGFVYLLQNNSMGWFFLLGFGFFLIMQAMPNETNNE